MTTFTEAIEERIENVSPDVLKNWPDCVGWITFARDINGMIILVFDRRIGEDIPVLSWVIRREDWQRMLDLMPGEWMSYPARTWQDVKDVEAAGIK